MRKQIKIGDLVVDYNNLSVTKKGETYNLTNKEFLLLYKLLSTPDTILYQTRTNGRNMGNGQ